MPKSEKLQRAIHTPILLYEKPVEEPFKPTPEPLFTPEQARYLDEVIPQPFPLPAPRIPVKPTPVEEQYELTERFAMVTSTTEKGYKLMTAEPKQILLQAEDNDHLVEFNRVTDENSTKIVAGGNLTLVGKGVKEIRAKTTTGTGKLRIRVWGP